MVHIKRIELTNFKSFGGTTKIPMMPGFTVVSGPNGSGKSNILDALLFCLGISTSKGMRAERLPDLVNHTQTTKGRGTVEASVTVTFDLGDDPTEAWELLNSEEEVQQESDGEAAEAAENSQAEEFEDDDEEEFPSSQPSENNGHSLNHSAQEWSITRRLRVTKQGTYTSTYYINGTPCTLTQLHEQLNRLRVYPEGYNVVLQGDVTSIISMNPRERREIIDELAGVAAFDRKISLAKEKLDEVKDREERSRIVERELIAQRDRLSQDRAKAEKYQKLRAELLDKEKWESVLVWRQHKQQEWQLREYIEAGDRESTDLTAQIATRSLEIERTTAELDQLNARVKALGEEELLNLQSTLATQEAEHRQLQQRQQELDLLVKQTTDRIAQTENNVKHHQQELDRLSKQHVTETQNLTSVQTSRDAAQQALDGLRQQSETIADASDAWIQQQTSLHRQIETLQKNLDPQRSEQARLRERTLQLESKIQEQHQSLQSTEQEKVLKTANLANVETLHATSLQQVESLDEALAAAELELQTLQETQKRLLVEQRENQRQLDKLEAQAQVMRETSGTGATQIIVQSGLSGLCGLVAQLGRVEPRYNLALETAAGGRLGCLVVEDDIVAAAAIALLKEKRAGRATFLPLNKIRAPRFTPIERLHSSEGFIDYAVNLIDYDPRYGEVFAYVFGNTVVFDILNNARRHLGSARIVTLEGDLLETTGAMTGGSHSSGSGSRLHFGMSGGESGEQGKQIASLRDRLQEIEQILEHCARAMTQAQSVVKARSQELMEAKQQRRDSQRQSEQIQAEIKHVTAQQEQLRSQLVKNTQELSEAQGRLQVLDVELPGQEAHLNQLRVALAELEQSQTHSEWQQMQVSIRNQEAQLQEWERSLRSAEQKLHDLENQRLRLQEKIQEGYKRLEEYRGQLLGQQEQSAEVGAAYLALSDRIRETKAALAKVEEHLGEEKKARDRAEAQMRERHLAKQQLEWQLQKLLETQQARREQLAQLQQQLQAQQLELPDPLPTVPENVDLEQLQKDVRSLQKRLQAMEPVNMLALEEYDRTQARLEELSQKLATLEAERTELLLRIENFTTLRLRAFREAFDAVNHNFQGIFAELSDGDGYLHLDDPEDPFSCGLNLVAHPKGKPVQRLASMSGGEKSLTALSFIFSLQRYRPSPFYAFDEVDMFLDGANVERLARMIEQQAQQAQFIVVSLRRPMIESSERTIGVTQARGAYTQVIGLKLQSKGATV